MKYVSAIVLSLLISFFSNETQAQQALSKELIQSMKVMIKKMAPLENKYAQLFAKLDMLEVSEPDKVVNFIKNSKAYPEILSILKSSGFSDLDEFYQTTDRIMGAMMAYQQEQMPQSMNFDDMSKMLASNIEQMKKNNAPNSMITEMQQQLAGMTKMKRAMNAVSAEDKKFISENAEWVMSVLDNGN